jgi:recombination protein RecA
VEVSAARDAAALSVAVRLLAEAQGAGDLAAWVTGPESAFYPPDAATHGVDLARLAVVRVPTPAQVPRAAARLAHSGAFGLIVLDLAGLVQVPDALLGRLVQQAQRHETLVLCLTHKAAAAPSLGSLVAVRAQATRRRVGADRFACTVAVLKDKRQGGGWRHEERLHGVPGLP